MRTIKHIWIHVAIISLTIIYFFAAPTIYAHFFQKYGKPVSTAIEVPPATNKLIIGPIGLTLTWIEGEELYQLDGWGFPWDLEKNYQRFFVLESDRSQYLFPIENS